METIVIKDLGVLCRIGVPEEERAKPQRLLITLRMQRDFSKACGSDDIADTVDYHEVSRRVARFCQDQTFKLIEKLAGELAGLILREFQAARVTVKVKKFVLSEARYVAFELTRARDGATPGPFPGG